ncbi:FGGY-family carbohydrate kinase [Lachnotalea glycerini]|uniref:Carbohydrate kinase n=1 Tax=Lachnotalea glycerini TaxID=1763509 RepID=A0A371JGX2_9FIRM|nr:FGGY family carbohydrate kinase [Lachnotalea glycerini]RDY31990.1 carbohydrate kinase [Lachnotalea glycerini]
MGRYYIGFDCGTQSTKTAIYSEDTTCVAEEMIPTNINYPKAGWAEMDADHYLESVRKGIKACLTKSGIDPKDVRAICGDGIICGIVGVNEDGKAITPYIPYLDSRTAQDAKWINENLEPIWIEESGNASVAPFYPPLLARWLIKNHEEFKQSGVKIMNNGPYVLSRLANLKAKDAFIDWATLSGWLIGYKAEEKVWSKEQMNLLEIPMELLPKIVKPWDIVGTLSEEEASLTGLPAGIPIVAGAGDTMQSNLGCGLVETGMAADVAGTAAMFTIMVDGINLELSKNSDLLFSIGTLPDTYFYWGYIRTGGLSLRWFRDNICGREGDNSFYDEIQELAQKVSVGSNGTLFFPYLQGGGGDLENASGCFLNMTTKTDQGEMWRAILESIAYEYLSLVNSLRENGISVDKIIITEGGSKSNLWNQIKADVLEANVFTLKRKEGAVMSNIALAAYAVGDIKDLKDAISKWIESKDTFTPNIQNTKNYQNIFAIQQKLLKENMKDAFLSLAKLNQ